MNIYIYIIHIYTYIHTYIDQFLDILGWYPNLTHHVVSALVIFKLHLPADWVWNSPQPAPKALDAHLSCGWWHFFFWNKTWRENLDNLLRHLLEMSFVQYCNLTHESIYCLQDERPSEHSKDNERESAWETGRSDSIAALRPLLQEQWHSASGHATWCSDSAWWSNWPNVYSSCPR